MSKTLINGFNVERLLERFNEKFGALGNAVTDGDAAGSSSANKVHRYFAPGRVNLIGDHTDYTGGFAFPCGIDSGSMLLIRRTQDNQFRFASTNFDMLAQLSKDQINKTYGDNWINYPLGVVDQFVKRGFDIDGIDCLFSGNVPNGAGLSSSASIEVVTAFAINDIFECGLSLMELVKMSQAAENDFVGMQCGIMDQFAVAMAQDNHAILLNCETLEHRQIPLALNDYAIVLANTNQRRELNESAYNERVAECARALTLLQQKFPINALGELKEADLEQHKSLFDQDNIAYLRAKHVSSENARVHAAVPALEQGDMMKFGKLMNQSHDSLRDCFHVSSEPLDHLVSAAREHPGVLGSRLTGAGFGGCTVNLLAKEVCDQFKKSVGETYQEKTGLTADFYTISPGAGVRAINA
ncbi:UNVERIFIED_CONTAM: hypothetical protein GTU68_055742 [Idotea baltica]|nr:hypothetical protein [Idotea baltica]